MTTVRSAPASSEFAFGAQVELAIEAIEVVRLLSIVH